MGFQVLGQSSAFSEGATLWIIPDLKTSRWAKRINWYTNVLVSNAAVHKRRDLSENLLAMIQEFEVDSQALPDLNSSSPTLVATHEAFPTQRCVVMPFNGDLREWIVRVYEIWKSFDRPLVRIFLPHSINEADFRDQWPKYIDIEWATLVPDRALL